MIDGLKQEEIAALLNISHNNVRTIYHRARKKVIDTVNAIA
ncbi:sigma-70 region 4 domain-containing protein [Niabella sp. W65]|nr:sigma-70 region 4 domain-containing protein [Niabella sp. W65]MCH7364336.1 sigma-70 region 4 domain-containing protein [Niabella sp. W65]ULT40203.1 sigma-70 region 4 domain-containing protein [Niabella sp. I65]